MSKYRYFTLLLVLPSLTWGATLSLSLGDLSKGFDTVLRFVGGREETDKVITVDGADQLTSPAFCNKLDCPGFTVVEKKPTYEVREYVATKWVSTTSIGIDYDLAQHEDFMRLFNYISGKNKKKQKVAMTAPVLNRIIPGKGPACANNFTMSFFVSPREGQPPLPSDPKVSLSSLPKQRVYVRSFGGVATKEMWLSEARELAKDLGSSVHYTKEYYFTAGYDSPYKLINRHNEIWFIAQ